MREPVGGDRRRAPLSRWPANSGRATSAAPTKTNRIAPVLICSPVAENKLRLNLAIAVVLPLSDQGLVMRALRQRRLARRWIETRPAKPEPGP